MSGRRCKAIRRAFHALRGRAPGKTFWRPFFAHVPSEWRRLKKRHLRAASTSEAFFHERAVTTAHRDEARRRQKRKARRKAAA